ncbi:MAG: DUF459 domain-containing protein [Solirubrobacterales bacterium]|nr:DUF459 domain-containing protein [Solirubrobacterales bacterium]
MGIAAVLLALFGGRGIRDEAKEMEPGLTRSTLTAIGAPTGWLADRLPFADVTDALGDALSPEDDLGEAAPVASSGPAAGADTTAPVDPAAFDPASIGATPTEPPELRKVLVTGDSMAMPLDVEITRRLADGGDVRGERDPHIGTGISKSDLLDWVPLAARQTRDRRPGAVVVFIGANEGFPLPTARGRTVECCGAEWAAQFATRARQMMNTYRQGGRARVYWLTLPLPRDAERRRIAQVVNAALRVAAEAYRAHVRLLDMERVFTPARRFRGTLSISGRETVVREADGIHLNDTGAKLAADLVLARMARDFAVLR